MRGEKHVEFRSNTRLVAATVGSNPALGLNAPQPPNQNCADDHDKQNSQLHLAFPIGRLMGPQHIHFMLTHPHRGGLRSHSFV
jgi:hypothetical protein